MEAMPKITVVTVTRNAEKTLEETILSVVGQTYANVEYVVIDGGSTDGTLDIVRKYGNHIDYWVSEPDRGIYDAMNKGWKHAGGEWIYYLGADDVLLRNGLELLANEIDAGSDIIYGNIIADNKAWGRRERKGRRSPECLRHCMCCFHQSAIMRKSVIERLNGFNVSYSVIADFDLFQRAYLKKYTFDYVDEPIAVYSMQGVSSYNLAVEFERYLIMRHNKSVRWPGLYFLYHFCRKALVIVRYKAKKSKIGI